MSVSYVVQKKILADSYHPNGVSQSIQVSFILSFHSSFTLWLFYLWITFSSLLNPTWSFFVLSPVFSLITAIITYRCHNNDYVQRKMLLYLSSSLFFFLQWGFRLVPPIVNFLSPFFKISSSSWPELKIAICNICYSQTWKDRKR